MPAIKLMIILCVSFSNGFDFERALRERKFTHLPTKQNTTCKL